MREGAMPFISDSPPSSHPKGMNAFNENDFNVRAQGKEQTNALGKENVSPMKSTFVGVYQAKPARSVYNSPLIRKNREPLWKSPVVSFPTSGVNPAHSEKEPVSIPNTYAYYRQPSASLVENDHAQPSIGDKSRIFARLYPSLPRSESGSSVKKMPEEKELKEHRNNIITANSVKSNTPLDSLSPGSPIKDDKNPLASSTFVETDESTCTPNLNTIEDESKLPTNLANEPHGCSISKCDIEDTFEMDRFLEEALGSQLLDTSSDITQQSCNGGNDSLYTLCCYRNLKKSVGSNSALSSVSTKFLSLPQLPFESQDDRVGRLLMEADRQQQLMMQASKALFVCRSAKTLSNPMHLVDGERLLLVASLRHQAALKEIQKTPLEIVHQSQADIQIMDIIAPLKQDQGNVPQPSIYLNQWFICVISCGEQILATRAAACGPEADCIRFSDILELKNLPSSFLATVQIYTLRVHTPRDSSRRKSIDRFCKLLRVQNKSCLGPAAGSNGMLFLRTPAFALSGTGSFSLLDIAHLQSNRVLLEKVPLMSPLQGVLSMKVDIDVKNTSEISGFLDKLEERRGCRAWQRRWCHLSGLSLSFWNYPADQDYKEPLEVIDLRASVSESVGLAPRSLCARARTMMLETKRPQSLQDKNSTLLECNQDCTVERHFLSCDSTVDLNEWVHIINERLSSIQTWKIACM